MKKGVKPLLLHAIHTFIVSCLLLISVVLGPCFGIDNIDEYACFFRNGEYTILSYFYGIPFVIFLLLLVILGSFHSIPYGIWYWIRYRKNPCLENVKFGFIFSFASILLIIINPFGIYFLTGTITDVSVIIYLILFSAYILPYSFIRLSYPQLPHLRLYKAYRLFLTVQLFIFLLLIAYLMSPFPEALKAFMDRKYLYWYHW